MKITAVERRLPDGSQHSGLQTGEVLQLRLIARLRDDIDDVRDEIVQRSGWLPVILNGVPDNSGIETVQAEMNGRILEVVSFTIDPCPWRKGGEYEANFNDPSDQTRYKIVYVPEKVQNGVLIASETAVLTA